MGEEGRGKERHCPAGEKADKTIEKRKGRKGDHISHPSWSSCSYAGRVPLLTFNVVWGTLYTVGLVQMTDTYTHTHGGGLGREGK